MKKLQYVPQQVIDDLLKKLGRGTQSALALHFGIRKQTVSKLLNSPDSYIGNNAQQWRVKMVAAMEEMLSVREVKKQGFLDAENSIDRSSNPFSPSLSCTLWAAWNDGYDLYVSDTIEYATS